MAFALQNQESNSRHTNKRINIEGTKAAKACEHDVAFEDHVEPPSLLGLLSGIETECFDTWPGGGQPRVAPCGVGEWPWAGEVVSKFSCVVISGVISVYYSLQVVPGQAGGAEVSYKNKLTYSL